MTLFFSTNCAKTFLFRVGGDKLNGLGMRLCLVQHVDLELIIYRWKKVYIVRCHMQIRRELVVGEGASK